MRHYGLGKNVVVDFIAGKCSLFCLIGQITLLLLMLKCMGLFWRKNYLLGCWCFLSVLNWVVGGCSYIISVAKTASKRIEALICSMKFLCPEVLLYLYKSTLWLRMKYCRHVWAGALSC